MASKNPNSIRAQIEEIFRELPTATNAEVTKRMRAKCTNVHPSQISAVRCDMGLGKPRQYTTIQDKRDSSPPQIDMPLIRKLTEILLEGWTIQQIETAIDIIMFVREE